MVEILNMKPEPAPTRSTPTELSPEQTLGASRRMAETPLPMQLLRRTRTSSPRMAPLAHTLDTSTAPPARELYGTSETVVHVNTFGGARPLEMEPPTWHSPIPTMENVIDPLQLSTGPTLTTGAEVGRQANTEMTFFYLWNN